MRQVAVKICEEKDLQVLVLLVLLLGRLWSIHIGIGIGKDFNGVVIAARCTATS